MFNADPGIPSVSNSANDEVVLDDESPLNLRTIARSYMRDIYEIMNLNQDVNFKNALELNKEMQNRLILVSSNIQALLEKISLRYAENEERLIETMTAKKHRNNGHFGKMIKGLTFYIRGNTFFKDENHRNAPNNNDYRERLNNGEIFPMDFDLVARHIWSITDKICVVKAIKEQIISDKHLSFRIAKTTQISTLLKKVGNDFKIDWEELSSHNLKYRHSPSSCKAMWDVYLHPSLKHNDFTQDENEILEQAAQKYRFQNWGAIAEEVGQRSDYQCFLQYNTSLVFRNKWTRWDKKDDNRLLEVIEAAKCNGVINWSQVAFHFPQKSKQALQQRYQYAINPALSHAPFSPEEDLLLIAAVKEYGTKFGKMPRSLFPHRSVIQLRARYNNTLQNRHKSKPWTYEDDKLLIDFVNENGTSAWKKLEEAFENRHTRIACRQRYVVIQRTLKKYPDSTLENLVRKQARYLRSPVTTKNWQEKILELRDKPLNVSTAEPSKRRRNRRKSHNATDQTTNLKLTNDCVNNEAENQAPHHVIMRRAQKRKNSSDNDKGDLLLDVSNEDAKNITQKQGSEANFAALCSNFTKKQNNFGTQLKDNKKKRRRQTKNPIYIERLRVNDLRFHNFLKFSYNFRFGRVSVINHPNYTDELLKARDCLGFVMPKDFDESAFTVSSTKEKNINGICIPVGLVQAIRMFLCNSVATGSKLEPTNFQSPPNFSTLCTLRALCVLSADYRKTQQEEIENNSENEDKAVQKPNADHLTQEKEIEDNSENEYKPVQKPNADHLTQEKEIEDNSENEDKAVQKPNVDHLTALNLFRQRFRNLFYKTAALSRLPPSSFKSQIRTHCSNNQEQNCSIIAPVHAGTHTQTDYSNNQKDSTSAIKPIFLGTQMIKNEFLDATETFNSGIKTEIDFESYKETN